MAERTAIQSFLAQVRTRWFARTALRAVAQACALAAVPVAAGLALQSVWRLEGMPLAILVGTVTLLAVTTVAMVVWRLPRRPDDRAIARFIEERVAADSTVPAMEDALVSAVDAMRPQTPSAVRDLLARAAVARLEAVTLDLVVPRRDVLRAATQAAAAAAMLTLAVVAGRVPLLRAVDVFRVGLFPAAIQVEVQPGDVRVAAGSPVRIRATVRGGDRSLTGLTPSLIVAAGAETRAVAMQRDGEGFVLAFESVDRTFRYRVTAGSAASREHTVTALFAPRVQRIDIRYEYPAFTKLPAREDRDSGDIYGPEGTRVRVRVQTDKPVVSGTLTFGSASAAANLQAAGERVMEAELVLARDDSYRVALADADGLGSRGDTEYFIRLMDDRPPDVRILRPAGDQQITPLEEVVIEARADDDHGIASFELVYATAGGQTRTVPFGRVDGTEAAWLGSHLLAAEDLRVQPGDVISYYARARDVGRGKRPTETRSDMFFLEVRPFNEEFVAAQSQAGASGMDPELEGLIAAQKEIINATWNLDRRSGVGRSVEDLRAVALAQADLKARVEQLTGRSAGGRTPFRAPQQLLPPRRATRGADGDSMSTAIAAMARAVEHLDRQRTTAALPQEMAALQALLQAQAEVRRRQVMQQQAGGGGGTGRQGQDLSALFDKELQRQQRTNYETRSQIEERPDRTNDAALERIRDLARRQEELSRRQRELAQSALSPEDVKRQLERLTREQMELRAQAEELGRQIDQQQAASGQPQGGQRGQPGAGQTDRSADGRQGRGQDAGIQQGAGGDMRGVSEEMRGAASDLERQDATAAAERSARAAERLRQIEQLMRGESPDAQARVAGELRLEAQQIAEEQRRIAAEAERIDRAGAGTSADARRRLAGEKERLAERVDALQRGAQQLAGEGRREGEGSSARAAEAARELERQQVGQRMRDTARQMRAGGQPEPRSSPRAPAAEAARLADGEQQIARTLDKVVDHLRGAGAEGRNLSAELGEAQSIRERLDALEQQIREREGRAPQDARGRAAQPSDSGRQGQQGRGGNGGAGQGGDLDKLREEYARELARARDTLARLQRGQSRDSLGGATPEQHEWSQADPGTEAFKQDYAGWQALRKDVNLALEHYESALSARLTEKAAKDRLNAGGSERVPDAYRRLIARYYEALAKARK
jgi:hypothetical protein